MKRWKPYLPLNLTREGAYYIGVLAFVMIGSVIREINLMLALAGFMIGPLLLSLIFGQLTLRKLSVRRRFLQTAVAGEPLTVELLIANRCRWIGSWLIWFEERWRRQDQQPGGLRGAAIVPRVLPATTAQVAYRCLPPRRGWFVAQPLEVTTRFPLGLLRHSRRLRVEDAVLVLPRLGRLRPAWSKLMQGYSQHGTSRQGQQNPAHGDFYGLRDYRPGDARRTIHWRTSARRGTLVVRQFEQPRHQDFALLLDLWQPAAPSAEQLAAVERAVSFAATVTHELCAQGGGRLCVAIGGRKCRSFTAATSLPFQAQVLENLAVAQADSSADAGQLFQAALVDLPAGANLVWIGTRPINREKLRNSGWQSFDRAGDFLASMTICDARQGGLDEFFDMDA